MLTVSNLTMQFGAKPLFENVSIKFGEGNRYGLIGANGSGKSTFMKIISGDLEASSGNFSFDPDESYANLKQDQFAFEEYNVIDTVIMGDRDLWAVKSERDAIYANPDMSEEDGIRVADLEVKFGEMDGYSAEARAGELLLGLGIEGDLHYGLMSSVAPGWKLRVLLAQVLFADPDIMLLDEPTNNLDIHTIQWLSDILNERKCTMIIISHDRHFLNSVCSHMADLDYGKIQVYPGNYDEYMLASMQARERTMSDNAKKEAKIKELQEFVRRFSANASKSKQATSRAKQIDKIELTDVKPSSRVHPYIRFEQEKELHRFALVSEAMSKSYDGNAPLFKDFDLSIEAGEKIAVIGANGVGKTTLMKALVGDTELDSGSIKWAENVAHGYCPQDHADEFAKKITLLDWMNEWRGEGDDEQEVRGTLGRLLFSKTMTDKTVDVLSGGEKARMIFGKLIMTRPNVMLLDEPTNHLDMESIESLNMALEKYDGTVIFISHDREFVSSLATRIIEITPEGITDYRGSYEEYLETKA